MDPRSVVPSPKRSLTPRAAMALAAAAMLGALSLAGVGLRTWRDAAQREAAAHAFMEFLARVDRENLRARAALRLLLVEPDSAAHRDFALANASVRATAAELRRNSQRDGERASLAARLSDKLELLARFRDESAATLDSGVSAKHRRLTDADYVEARAAADELLASMRQLERIRSVERHADSQAASSQIAVAIAVTILLASALAWWALSLQRREALRRAESEAQFRTLADADPDALVVHVNGRVLFANAAAARYLGVASPELLVGRSMYDFLASDAERAEAHARARGIQSSGRPSTPTVVTMRAADGTEQQFEARGAPIEFQGAAAIVVALRDVSARLAAERALRESEARYRLLAEHSVDLVMIRALDGSFLYVSPSFEQIPGWRPEELLGRPSDGLLHPDDVPEVIALDRALRNGASAATAITRLRHRDGHWVACEGVAQLHRGTDGEIEGISVTARDISERRMLEEQVHQGQKQEAVGRMAGGVAHDFNTLLTVVRASAGLLRDERIAAADREELLDEIDGAVERAVGLTAQMLNIAQGQHETVTLVSLGDLARRSLSVMPRLAGRAISTELSVSTAVEGAVVAADPARLDQVLLNLVLNAKDAMPTGGTLSVRAEVAHLAEPLRHHHGVIPPATYLTIALRDSGIGMTPKVLDRAFDPFFTTKPQGKGSGLGLSASLGIVRQAGGAITVESAPGAGATFTVYWPLADVAPPSTSPRRALPAAASLASAPSVAANPDGSSAIAKHPATVGEPMNSPAARHALPGAPPTIVLVDDEPMLVRVATRVLEGAGYHIVSAIGGAEALAIVRRERDAVAALLVDVRMPGMGGVDLVSALLAEGIDLPVLFMSGHLDAPLPSTWPPTVPRHFLGKPYEHHELLGAVDQLLGAVRDIA
ncbi:MAG: PAS domain S-box protein [Gemmatimonadaceae bacterium]